MLLIGTAVPINTQFRKFIARKNIIDIPTQNFNTPKGYINVSTPEATALDLVNYPKYCGGLSNVATILEELAQQIKPKALNQIAKQWRPTPQLQRLGFLFEKVQLDELASIIERNLQKRTFRTVALVSKITNQGKEMPFNKRWKIIENETIESDL
jgi:predicted transcriptional regulator of viral defense system